MKNFAANPAAAVLAPAKSRGRAWLGPWLLLGLLLPGSALADPPAWTNPAYGPWHSCVIGGGGYLLDAVICPSDPRRIYAYGDMDGLFRSDDAGNTWRIIHGAMEVKEGHYEFAGLTVNPRNADEIAVACGGQDGPRQGVFVSGDGGETWAKTLDVRLMGNGPFRWAGPRIAQNSGQPGCMIAATAGSGVWRSEDGGHTWHDGGLPGIFFTDVRFDRTNPDRVWLCAEPVRLDSGEFRQLSGGMYRSEDRGQTWTRLSAESPFEIAQDPVEAGVLYGLCETTVKRSIDAGATWQDFSDGLPAREDPHLGTAPFRAIGTGPDFVLVVQNDTKMTYRLDRGQSRWQAIKPVFDPAGWRFKNFLPPANDASSISVSPLDRNHWYMTDEFGIYQSWDAGRTWKPSDQGIETTVIHAITQDPTNPARVYLGAADVGFWWSDDAGTVLNQTKSAAAGWVGNIKCVDASMKPPARVYAVGGEGWKSDRIYVSTDGGKSVSRLATHGTGLPNGPFACDSIAVDPGDPDSVYLATATVNGATTGGVFHSGDGGKSWTWAGKGLPPGKPVFQDNIWWGGRELAPGPDGTLLAASARCDGVYRFDRAAGTWAALNFPHHGGVYSVVADPLNPGRFYVCVVGDDARPGDTGGGLFRTDDAGVNWQKILAGSVHAVACDRGVRNRVIASNGEGVFLSTDGGSTWGALDPLPNRWVHDSVAFAGDRVLVGSGGNGAFWLDLRERKPPPGN